MRTVEIFRRRPEDAETERVGRVFVREPGQPAEFEVFVPEFQNGFAMILAEGVADERGRSLYLADGEAFLSALPAFYHGSRFWAEDTEDGRNP